MQAIKDLKLQYYLGFFITLLLNLILIVAIVLLAVNKTGIFGLDELPASIVFYLLILVLSLCEAYFIYSFTTCLRDFKNVRKNCFEELYGTVIRYARNQAETGQQLNNFPIIKGVNCGKEIKLMVNKDTEINGTYTFIYLKHTKIGVVKKN